MRDGRNRFALHRVSICLVVAPLLMMFCSRALAEDSETTGLLQTLRVVRQATTRAFESGVGNATVTIDDNGSVRKERIAFKFYNGDSLAEVADATKPSQPVVQSFLWKRNTQVCYWHPGGFAPVSVSITAVEPYRFIGLDLRGWSYRDFMEIPLSAPSEEVLFNTLLNKTDAKVSMVRGAGSLVTLTLTAPPDPSKSVSKCQWVVDCDMAMGGAMTSCTFTLAHLKTTDQDEIITVIMKWAKDEAGRVLPQSRVLHETMEYGNGTESRIVRTITFDHLEAIPISEQELSLAALHIPNGTPVVDYIRHTQWKHPALGESLPSDEEIAAAVKAGKAAELPATSAHELQLKRTLAQPFNPNDIPSDSGKPIWLKIGAAIGLGILFVFVIVRISQRTHRGGGNGTGIVKTHLILWCFLVAILAAQSACSRHDDTSMPNVVLQPNRIEFGHIKGGDKPTGTCT